jgi:hypothetical protein
MKTLAPVTCLLLAAQIAAAEDALVDQVDLLGYWGLETPGFTGDWEWSESEVTLGIQVGVEFPMDFSSRIVGDFALDEQQDLCLEPGATNEVSFDVGPTFVVDIDADLCGCKPGGLADPFLPDIDLNVNASQLFDATQPFFLGEPKTVTDETDWTDLWSTGVSVEPCPGVSWEVSLSLDAMATVDFTVEGNELTVDAGAGDPLVYDSGQTCHPVPPHGIRGQVDYDETTTLVVTVTVRPSLTICCEALCWDWERSASGPEVDLVVYDSNRAWNDAPDLDFAGSPDDEILLRPSLPAVSRRGLAVLILLVTITGAMLLRRRWSG